MEGDSIKRGVEKMKKVLSISLSLIVPLLGAGTILYFFWWNRSKAELEFLPARWLNGDVVARYTVTHWKESGQEKATAAAKLDFKKAGKYVLENWSAAGTGGNMLGEELIEVTEKEVPKTVEVPSVGGRLELFRLRK